MAAGKKREKKYTYEQEVNRVPVKIQASFVVYSHFCLLVSIDTADTFKQSPWDAFKIALLYRMLLISWLTRTVLF